MDATEIRRWFEALSEGDVNPLAERLAEECVLEFPGRRFGGRVEGRRKVAVFLRQNQRLFREGLRFRVHWAGVAGDRGVAQWTNEGETRDGQAYANRGVTVFRFAGDQVAEISDYLDTERIAETWSS